MYKVNELAKLTGLKEPFIRRCLRELKDIFEPHIERGAKNSLVLASSIIPIFDKIKQDKANGLSLPAIKNLLNSDVIVSKQAEKDFDKKVLNTAYSHSGDEDDWIGVKAAVNLTGKSETTIRRLIVKFKGDHTHLKKDESSQRDKWLLSKRFVLKHFNNHDNYHDHDHGDNHGVIHDHNQNNIQDNIQSTDNNEQVIELLEKQIEDLQKQLQNQTIELKEQLKQKDAQIEKQSDDFKEQLNNLLSQKDQQIHQLHVLLKESKASTIDYKPDENLGVFSKVLVKFGL